MREAQSRVKPSDPGGGLANEKIHDRLQRLALCCTGGTGRLEGAQLPVRTRPASEDGANMSYLPLTP